MHNFKEHFIVDTNGNHVGIMLSISEYQKILADLEELESIRAYDLAKASGDEASPFEQAILEI